MNRDRIGRSIKGARGGKHGAQRLKEHGEPPSGDEQVLLREHADAIAIDAVFRRVIGRGTEKALPGGRGRVGERLSVDAIAQAFKRVAEWTGMSAEEVAEVSGHSIRVGATQDLLALNIDLASVMQAGRWKTHRMPMRYGEHVLAARGGMARAAQAQGRDIQMA